MATNPAMDHVTAGAIRQALSAAAAGRFADACAVGERALVQGGDIAALNAMLGMLQGKAGNVERAIDHLRVAHRARPEDPIIAFNLADVPASIVVLVGASAVVTLACLLAPAVTRALGSNPPV